MKLKAPLTGGLFITVKPVTKYMAEHTSPIATPKEGDKVVILSFNGVEPEDIKKIIHLPWCTVMAVNGNEIWLNELPEYAFEQGEYGILHSDNQ